MINYMFFSRVVYVIPFLIYLALHQDRFLTPECVPYVLLYGIILCFSVIFYSFARKIIPLALIHFVFLAETVLISLIAIYGANLDVCAFIILASFCTIEALRNETLHICLHVIMVAFSMFLLYFVAGVDIFAQVVSNCFMMVVLSSLVCRAVMSMIENQNVVVQEVVKQKTVYAVEEDNEKIQALNKTIKELTQKNNSLTTVNNNMQYDKNNIQNEVYALRQQNALLEEELEKTKNISHEKQEINQDIARSYFSLLANTRFDLTRTFDENIDNLLNVFLTVTKAKYVCMVCKRNFTEEGEEVKEGFYSLSNSSHTPDIHFLDEDFVGNKSILTNIRETVKKNAVQYQTSVNIEKLAPLSNIVYAPISLNGDVKGVLVQAFDNQHTENIHYFNLTLMVAYQLYNMLVNENLYRQVKNEANIDGLTGAYNKKHLLEVLPVVINNAYNYDIDIGLMFVDIDYFKQVNDNYGHNKGDEVLCQVVDILTNNIRKTDMLFRYGGDEFVIVMSGMTEEKMQELFNNAGKDIKNLGIDIPLEGGSVNMSLSMGGIIYKPSAQLGLSADELLQRADSALYEAKRSGKNNIFVKKE